MSEERLVCATMSLLFGMLTDHPIIGFLGAMLFL